MFSVMFMHVPHQVVVLNTANCRVGIINSILPSHHQPNAMHHIHQLKTLPYSFYLLCSSVCPCACNYAFDAGCTCRDLVGSIPVTFSTSAQMQYKGYDFIRIADPGPYEEVVYGASCSMDATTPAHYLTGAAPPTCGWTWGLNIQSWADVELYSEVRDYQLCCCSSVCHVFPLVPWILCGGGHLVAIPQGRPLERAM